MFLEPEDLPVTDRDREVLRGLRRSTLCEFLLGCQALAEAFPHLSARAARRPTFAGRKPFDLSGDPQPRGAVPLAD
ncbi:MAG: hypothetical protein ACP5NF_06335 [Thermoanaerobaculum sp.]